MNQAAYDKMADRNIGTYATQMDAWIASHAHINVTPAARLDADHAEALKLNGTPRRQFCRTCLTSKIPAFTLSFGSSRLHWCAEHVSDGEQYR